MALYGFRTDLGATRRAALPMSPSTHFFIVVPFLAVIWVARVIRWEEPRSVRRL
jgi:hypothetical protein